MNTLLRTFAIAVGVSLLAVAPSAAQVMRLSSPPSGELLTIKELLAADQIIAGTVRRIEYHRHAELPQKGYAAVTLSVHSFAGYPKGRPDGWTPSQPVELKLELPLATGTEEGDKVLWFLKNGNHDRLSVMGFYSGYFQVFEVGEHEFVAMSLFGNDHLWSNPGGLWKLFDRPGKMRKDVESAIRANLKNYPQSPEETDRYVHEWLRRADAPGPGGRLPLYLLLAVVDAYLNPT